MYTVDEMEYSLRKSKAKFVVVDKAGLDRVLQAVKRVGLDKKRVLVLEEEGEAPEGFMGVRRLCEIGAGWGMDQVPEFQIPRGKTNEDVPAFLGFSSGTTGLPKAVSIFLI